MPIRQLLLSRPVRVACAFVAALGSASASAQLRLPTVPLPQLPSRIDSLNDDMLRDANRRLLAPVERLDLRELRLNQIDALLRRHGDVLERDPHGEPIVRHELLAWSPSAAALAAAKAAGLEPVRQPDAGAEASPMVVLRVPEGVDSAAMLERLRALDPDGAYDFNHIYTGSGNPAPPQGMPAADQDAPRQKPVGGVRLGLVDGGVQGDHEVFREAPIVPWGCDGTSHPSAHGTAVAALMVGRSPRFAGAAPGATLYAADIYCDSGSGGSASRITAALDWLAQQQVAVINLSLVGPPNQILERAVRGMVRRGHLLVAAVGNDGPAAPPLYPASYPGVVGVSGVDKKGQPLPEAARGPQVMFAAPGNQMISAAVGTPPYRAVRGTSFAAPIVAALLAKVHHRPDPAAARQALASVTANASGAAAGNVDNGIGLGILGMALRTDPASFR